ncbi:cation:proton antiporter [Acidaminobacter sp. JC074]|uniref:cation:proton antiporter n=1 Tax=Acidaminobacter sp. JC074 TaxID=2530199 RepID=UPI001F0F7FB1|nr:cation:proton antiporter [Acidaminobacter sp. JC074]MCH4886912.1 cation:proton antiporter [Acidaminobacter sp. JC074]
MHADTGFMIQLLIILFAAIAGGMISKHLGQPRILGQILAGVLIGPSLLGFVEQSDFISHLAELGVILLMFLAGLETDLEELKSSFENSSKIALGGIIVPFGMGFLGLYLVSDTFVVQEGVFLGVILTATSMGIAIQTLSEMGRLKSRFGMSILGAAIIDDVAGVLILAIALGIFGKSQSSIALLVGKIILFFVLISLVGGLISKFIFKNKKWFNKISSSHLLAGSFLLTLLFAITASEFGMAAIIGAYFVGLIISTTPIKHKVFGEIEKFGTGFFIPIFFVNIGMSVNLKIIGEHIWMALFVTTIGIVSKVIGSYIGGRLSDFDKRDALQIGISMVPRAEVALIIANIGLKSGFIGEGIFTGIILLVIVSSVLTPLLLKLTSKKVDEKVPQKHLKKVVVKSTS